MKNQFVKKMLFPALTLLLVVILAACSSKTTSTTTTTAAAAPTTAAATTPPVSTPPSITQTTTTPTTTTTTTTTTTVIPAPPITTSSTFTVMINSNAALGKYLTDGKGMTLYYYTKDSPGMSMATAAILANWPAFSPTSFIPGPGLSASDFATITTNGQPQATFKGWPLYYYAKDKVAGDTLGQGIGNVWYVIGSTFPPTPVTTTTVPPTTASPSPTVSTPAGPAVTLNITAVNIAFDKSTLTVKAGSSVTLIFENQDTGIPHNVSIYQNLAGGQVKSIFVGEIIKGPNTITYTFTAPAAGATYFFQCDVHPNMTGTFVVTP
jgi:predicted lipoprotein with Yx(FWY)xxD motif/plastocyanin